MTRARPGLREVWFALILVLDLCGHATAQSPPDELASLNERVIELYQAGKYDDAIPLAERSLQLTRAQNGNDHVDTATRTSWLAVLHRAQGRLAEASASRGSASACRLLKHFSARPKAARASSVGQDERAAVSAPE